MAQTITRPNLLKQEESICFASILTTAARSDPTPPSIGHAGTSAGSLQGVPLVTGVVHCGSKGCSRATSLTICRSIRGWTTDDDCREGTGTTFPVATMQAHSIQCKLKGMKAFTCTIMQEIHIYIYKIAHRCTYTFMRESYTPIYTSMVYVNTCIYLHVLQSLVSL